MSEFIGIQSVRKTGGFNDVIFNICNNNGYKYFWNSYLQDYYKFDDTIPFLCDMTTSSLTHNFIKYRIKNNLDYYHIDHAYFWRGYAQNTGNNNPFNCEWFRISKNCHALNKILDVDDSRWKKYFYDYFGGYGKEYSKTGSRILFCPPSSHVLSLYNQQNWVEETLNSLRKHTDREIVIRSKPNSKTNNSVSPSTNTTLEEDLNDCWALVTHSSCASITAHLLGIPTFSDFNSPSNPVSLSNFTRIEYPYYPNDEDRIKWLNSLAFSQYSMDEFTNENFNHTILH